MRFEVHGKDFLRLEADILALGAFEDQMASVYRFHDIDQAFDGLLGRIVSEEEFKGRSGQSILVHAHGRAGLRRALLLGLGKREEFEIPDLRRYAALASREASQRRCRRLALTLPLLDIAAQGMWFQLLVEGCLMGLYRFQPYLGQDSQSQEKLESIVLVPSETRTEGERKEGLELSVARGENIAASVNWARDLVNEPPARMTPSRMAEVAQELALQTGMSARVMGPRECEKQRMMLLLAVSRGSSEEPRFIHLTYRPRGKHRPRRRIALVGKGVTFDSGGLSLKNPSQMQDMKTDMAGAGALLGVARALPLLGLKSVEVHILVPAVENMVSGSAMKVGDIVTGLGGKSIEIANTDAEGRLILADALAYAVRIPADEIIDLATLTGSCAVALGPHIAGLMSTDRAMAEHFQACARKVGEEVWPLPLPARLKEQLKSPIADMKNLGDRYGGALTAGLFLKEFVGRTPWLHLDIAGPAVSEKEWGHIPRGATGFGVCSVLEYLRSRDELS